jgi:hypothetical protein
MWLKSNPRGDSYQAEITGYMGVDPKKPQLGVLNYLDSTFKHLSKMDITNFKAADFLKFADDFKEGKLPVTMKSDPPIKK